MAPLSEELTYTCYRTGTLISIAADYYSYLGGAHPQLYRVFRMEL